jgi:hypothetical protein
MNVVPVPRKASFNTIDLFPELPLHQLFSSPNLFLRTHSVMSKHYPNSQYNTSLIDMIKEARCLPYKLIPIPPIPEST